MGLNNIELQPANLQGLYKSSLVEIHSEKPVTQPQPASSLGILGKNLQRIVIVVSNNDAAFLHDEELNFLLGILSACKLNMDDVGILNLSKFPAADYKKIDSELNAGKVFLFGLEPAAINLPLAFPYYQIQQYNNQTYLSAPALSAIQQDKAEKGKLWNCLRQIFSI